MSPARPKLTEADKLLSEHEFSELCDFWNRKRLDVATRGPRRKLFYRNWMMLRTLGETGLRASELARLELRDLQLLSRSPHVLVRRGKWRQDGEADSVFIGARLADELEQYLRRGLALVPGAFLPSDGTWTARLFTDSKGGPITRRDVSHAVRQAVLGCGFNPKFSAHTFRHFAISTWCSRPGASPYAVAKQARLRSMDLILRYFHSSPAKQAELVKNEAPR